MITHFNKNYITLKKKKGMFGTYPVAQWLRIRLPMQETQVRSLVQEDPTCRGATKPVCHNYWACALELASQNYWARTPQLLKPERSRAPMLQLLSLHAATTEVRVPRACAPQEEKPPQWEARTPQQRVAPACRNQRKPACSNEDPTYPKIKINKKLCLTIHETLKCVYFLIPTLKSWNMRVF